MESPKRLPRRRWARGQARPRYLEPGDIDRMMIMFVALMSEVSALRDRVDTHEAIADAGQLSATKTVEGFELTSERRAVRETDRQAMLRRVFRAITEEREAAQDGTAKS